MQILTESTDIFPRTAKVDLSPIFVGNATIHPTNRQQHVRNQSRLETSNQDRDFSSNARNYDDQVHFVLDTLISKS